MIFRQFLLEQTKLEPGLKTWEKIKKECKKYLNDIGYKNLDTYKLIRQEKKIGFVYKKSIRKNRRPTDTPLWIHNWINELLKKKGLPTRSDSLFVWGDRSKSINYFKAIIIPVGSYKFTYNPNIVDFYAWLSSNIEYSDIYTEPKDPFIKRKLENEILEKYINKMKTDSIKKAIEANTEILISADYYYAIWAKFEENYYEEFVKYIQGSK